MERKSLMSESLIDHSIGAQENFNPPKPNMFKGPWMATAAAYQSYGDHHHHHHLTAHHEYIGGGLSWPPRSYSCTFCKREFRSAQALGGHMNVHRRDRARLRQLSPPPTSSAPASSDGQYPFLSLNPGNANPILSPNPSPDLQPNSPSPFVPPRLQAPLGAISAPFIPQINLENPLLSSRFRLNDGMKVLDGDFFGERGSIGKDLCSWTRGPMNSNGMIKLGMEVEVVKEDLDLELRLGCP
ncbi:hypothetical protein MLD38_011969 [Melastoma candidum]|uniref:Uncharacterized protein n=1 Tax=Melastoma candidum TaxID=119954 RepID=A0ACB9R5D9_9MYRT|nr:hypothetical protein MLD38_011969 [Melastoma candidum]